MALGFLQNGVQRRPRIFPSSLVLSKGREHPQPPQPSRRGPAPPGHVIAAGARPAAEHAGRRRPIPGRGLPRVGVGRGAWGGARGGRPRRGVGTRYPEKRRGGRALPRAGSPLTSPARRPGRERRAESPPPRWLSVNSSSEK